MMADKERRPIFNPLTTRTHPFLARIDWVCRWINYSASNIALFKALEYASKLTVAVALIVWLVGIPERWSADNRAAWSVVGAKGGGRKESLEFLSNRWFSVDLRGLNAAGGYFSKIDLSGKDLSWSDLSGANFEGATMTKVKLNDARLSGTKFAGADLKEADFTTSHFEPEAPDFTDANLDKAKFKDVTGLNAAAYLSLSNARNLDTADIDNETRRRIACASKVAAPPLECQLAVPDLGIGQTMMERAVFLNEVVASISCELRSAVSRVSSQFAKVKVGGRALQATFLKGWDAQIMLTLSGGAQGAEGEAMRTNKLGLYFQSSELLKANPFSCAASNNNGKQNDSVVLRSDLKLTDWLIAAMLPYGTMDNGSSQPGNILEHEVKFVIVKNGTNSQANLSAVVVNSTGGVTLGAGARVYDLLVTLGPPEILKNRLH